MEELTGGGAVDTYFVDLRGIVADVFDVAEDVAECVLRDEVAEVGAEAHVGDGGFVETPGCYGEVFEEDESFAVDQVVAEGGEAFAEGWEGEVGL